MQIHLLKKKLIKYLVYGFIIALEALGSRFWSWFTYKCGYSLSSIKGNTPCRALAWNSGMLQGILLWALLN